MPSLYRRKDEALSLSQSFRQGSGETPRKSLIACLPAYDEEAYVAKIVIGAQAHVDKVLVCDDGSRDMTGAIAAKMGAEVMRHETREGKGAALRTLFEACKKYDPDIVVTIDADGQSDPGEIPKLISPIIEGKADVVVGTRFIHDSQSVPRYRRFGNAFLTRSIRWISRSESTDSQSGFRAYSREALKSISIAQNGMSVDSEIIMNLSDRGFRIEEAPVTCTYHSGSSTFNPVRHSLAVLRYLFGLATTRKSLIVIGGPSIVLIATGTVLLFRVVLIYNQSQQLALGTMLGAVMFLQLGALALFTSIILNLLSKLKLQRNDQS